MMSSVDVTPPKTPRSEFGYNLFPLLHQSISFGAGQGSVMLAHGLDDGAELGLKRGASDEESIDVLLADKVSAVAGVGGATVLDPSGSGNLSGDVLAQPGANVGVGILSDGWGGCLSSADGPDGLVGNDEVGPAGDGTLYSVKLSLDDIIGLTSFALLKSLTDAEDDLEAVGLGAGSLGSDHLVSLTVELSALGVTNKGPLKAEVLDLLSRDLSGEGTVATTANVLGSDKHVRVEHGLGGGDVESDRGHDDLNTLSIELESVKGVRAEGADGVN